MGRKLEGDKRLTFFCRGQITADLHIVGNVLDDTGELNIAVTVGIVTNSVFFKNVIEIISDQTVLLVVLITTLNISPSITGEK